METWLPAVKHCNASYLCLDIARGQTQNMKLVRQEWKFRILCKDLMQGSWMLWPHVCTNPSYLSLSGLQIEDTGTPSLEFQVFSNLYGARFGNQ